MLNRATQRSALINYLNPTVRFPHKQNDTQLALLREIGLQATVRLCDHVNLYASYQGVWIDGVAVASDQVAKTNFVGGSNLNNSSDVFYHGGSFGFEVAF